MTAKKHKGINIIHLLWIPAICFFATCFHNSTNYPYPIEKAINLFFIENENDSVINILNDKNLSTEYPQYDVIRDIFIAAALSESGMADSARIILANIDSTSLNENDKYYFNFTHALIEFRLDNLQEFAKIATPLLSYETIDPRCRALIQRQIARSLYYYEDFESAIQMMINSSNLFGELKLDKSVAINKKFLASFYTQLGSYNLAIENLYEAEKTLKEYNDLEELYYLYIVGLKTYISSEKPDSARFYADLALITINDTLSNQKLSSIYYYIGMIEKLDSNYNDAIEMFDKVLKVDNNFFGANIREIETYIRLASIYNLKGDSNKAAENAVTALNKIGSDGSTYLKYEAYKELSEAYYKTDPILAYNYLDSAENNLIKYQELSSKRVADFVNTQDALESAYNQIIELELIKKRNKIILILILVILIVIIISCLLVNSLNKKVKNSSAELVKKNLTQLKYEEKVNDLIKKQINSSENRSDILYEKLNSWLEKEKKYLQPDIDLNMAAREIGTNRSYLSKSINQHGIGFNEIINRYRIREVIRIFENENEERNSYTLQKLATAVGFNTKSVFFDSFRKETGMTPAQFRENIQYTKTIKD